MCSEQIDVYCGQSRLNSMWDRVCMQAAGFRNSLVPFASAILGHPLMKNVYAWIGGRAVLGPSGLVAASALGFPFSISLFCWVAELNFGFIFPCHFSPMAAWVPGRGLPAASLQHSCGGSVGVALCQTWSQLWESSCSCALWPLNPPAPPPSYSLSCPLSGPL